MALLGSKKSRKNKEIKRELYVLVDLLISIVGLMTYRSKLCG